jgi:hypothetical protein
MKVGDLVKHSHGVLYGEGLILKIVDSIIAGRQLELLWNCHGHQTFQQVGVKHFEVISESR